MAYTNSSLISSTNLSPNFTSGRECINRVTWHHTATAAISAERIGEIFANAGRNASCNYGIGDDGKIILIVEEKNRSWCSSSAANDKKAITFEISNSKYGEPWPISDAAYESAIALTVDICQRNGITEVFNIQKEIAALPQKQRAAFANNYQVPAGKLLLTQHNYFASTACPGTTIKNDFDKITADINARLSGSTPAPTPEPEPAPETKAPKVAKPTLKTGNTGAQVKLLQEDLKYLGFDPGKIDGIYGAKTYAALKAYQETVFVVSEGMTYKQAAAIRKEWDGVYGPKTAAKIEESLK